MSEKLDNQEVITQNSADTANPTTQPPQSKDNGLVGGKFKTVDALLESYNKLEAEFSRRSEKLKELEGKLADADEESKWNVKLTEFFAEFPLAKEYSTQIVDYIAENVGLLASENCLERALIAVLTKNGARKKEDAQPVQKSDKKVKVDNAISAQSAPATRRGDAPTLLAAGGNAPTLTPKRPQNIREASALALEIITKSIKM